MSGCNYKGEALSGPPRRNSDVLDLGFAVFNGHVNDANKRARALLSVLHPHWLAEVEAIEVAGNGIMAIFNQKMTDATLMYATLVMAFVNEKARFERVAPPGPELVALAHDQLD